MDHSYYSFTIVNFCAESQNLAEEKVDKKTIRYCVFINAKVYTFNCLQTEQIEHALCMSALMQGGECQAWKDGLCLVCLLD